MNKAQKNQVDALVKQFQKTKERGEFRNKLGRVWWPMMNRFITYGIPALAVASVLSGGATLPALGFGAATWLIGGPVTKGFSVNVQNIALKNAAVFGRSMNLQKVPEDVRMAAVDRYLQKAGTWVFNKEYLKKNPENLAQLANGKSVAGMPNLVALFEHNMNQMINNATRKGEKISSAQRWEMYQKTWAEYKEQTQKKPHSLPKKSMLQVLNAAQVTADTQQMAQPLKQEQGPMRKAPEKKTLSPEMVKQIKDHYQNN